MGTSFNNADRVVAEYLRPIESLRFLRASRPQCPRKTRLRYLFSTPQSHLKPQIRPILKALSQNISQLTWPDLSRATNEPVTILYQGRKRAILMPADRGDHEGKSVTDHPALSLPYPRSRQISVFGTLSHPTSIDLFQGIPFPSSLKFRLT